MTRRTVISGDSRAVSAHRNPRQLSRNAPDRPHRLKPTLSREVGDGLEIPSLLGSCWQPTAAGRSQFSLRAWPLKAHTYPGVYGEQNYFMGFKREVWVGSEGGEQMDLGVQAGDEDQNPLYGVLIGLRKIETTDRLDGSFNQV